MKKFLFLILFLIAYNCYAATYYMRADGTAANATAATGPCETAANCMTINTHNGETFSANDIIYLCDDGGVFIDDLIPPSNGTAENPILYQAAPGDTPIIDMATIVGGWSNHAGHIYKTTLDDAYLDSSDSAACGGEPCGFVYLDGAYDSDHWPDPVPDIGSVVQNSWFYDDTGNLLYIWLYDDSNASAGVIKAYTAGGCYPNINISNKDYITIDGITTRNGIGLFKVQAGSNNIIFKNSIGYGGSTCAIRVEYNAANVTIQDCEFHSCISTCVQLNGTYSTIKRSDISNISFVTWHPWSGSGIILLGSHNLATKNKVYDNFYNGILFESWGNGGDTDLCHDNIASYNYLFNNNGSITFTGGDNNTAMDNIIVDDILNGIYLSRGGVGGYGDPCSNICRIADGNKIYNNTIIDAAFQSIRIYSNDGNVTNTIIKNNILNNVNPNQCELQISESGYGNVIDYNLYRHSKWKWDGTVYTDWETYKTASSQDANSPSPGDPLLTDTANDDFTLAPGSPCINAGIIPSGFETIYSLDPRLTVLSPWVPVVMPGDYNDREIGAYGYVDLNPKIWKKYQYSGRVKVGDEN